MSAAGLPARSLWRHRDFLHLWTAESVSVFGSQVTVLALPLAAVLTLRANALEMGLLEAAGLAPYLVVALPAGAWIDRLPRRRPLLVSADAGRALLLASIPAAAALGALTLAQLYAVALLAGTLTVLFNTAYQGYLPALVERDQLVDGNAKLQTSFAAAQVAGPGLAGVLVQAVTAPFAIAVDALSFVVSALVLGRIAEEEPTPAAQRRPLLREIREGLRFVLGDPTLRAIAGSAAT